MNYPTDITKAKALINSIYSFILEFEASQISPNLLFLNKEHLQIIKKFFPHYVSVNVFTYESRELEIIITHKETVGVAYSYFTNHYLDYLPNESA